MAKKYSHRKITKKSLIAVLCAMSVTCTGLAAACAPEEEQTPSTPSKEDSSLLKNGSFEYFDIPDDAVYLIKNVSDWSLGGESSVKSGIIGTSDKDWAALTESGLAETLEYNYDLGSSDDNYVDYNSMRKRDMLYKDSYAALLDADDVEGSLISHQGYEEYFGIKDGKYAGKDVYFNEDDGEYYFDEEFTECIRYALIENPETHYGVYTEKDGKYYLGSTEVYKDDEDNLYLDEDKEELVGNVLMIHNYSTDGNYNGIQQYYTSVSINLEANTAAEISLWVKTSDLKFDKGYNAIDEQDKGAFIEVAQTVGGNTIDSFVIKNINTEKIIKYSALDGVEIAEESNGWLHYTVYVNSCDFAASTIQLKLGLGQSGAAEKCTGYAFFDDVEVTKYRDLEDSSYKGNEALVENTGCTLTSDEEKKIFNADRELREQSAVKEENYNYSYDFHYYVDLASEIDGNGYNAITLGTNNVYAALTSEKAENESKVYASNTSSQGANFTGVTRDDADVTYELVKNMTARPVENDLVGTFGADTDFAGAFSGIDYSTLLKDALTGDSGITSLPKYDAQNSNMLVILSSYGAAYTATVKGESAFDLSKTNDNRADKYLIVSFWLKTSDMNGKTAATIKLYDANDEDNYQTITVDTTGITANFDNEKDIYNGWVQCFFFVKNTVKFDADGDNTKQFNIDFSFGNTSITGATSFDGGWAAIANLQTLVIDEDIYNLASADSYCSLFSFTSDEDEDGGFKMDEASTTSDIKTGIAAPSSFNGINGANSAVSNVAGSSSYDAYNTNDLAGLINKDYYGDYSQNVRDALSTSFGLSTSNWSDVFGDDCYQPLIIINNLRKYVDKYSATESDYEDYYIEAEDGNIVTADGKTYKSAKGTDWDEEETYYSLKEVANYGFAGGIQTAASDSYTTVSVRVMVTSGATAYIYLVDGSDTKNVLSYSTPAYTFWYDEEGNVLDEELDPDWKEKEHREHIVYTLRDDGLYDGADGKVYANLHNLIKNYKNYKFEHNTFYDENGNAVSFDNLVNGETYYADADKTTVADHYLVNSANKRIFECVDGKYYYLEEGKRTTEVENFDEEAYARYNYEALDEKYEVAVGDTDGKWVTVNFHIHTGSESKSYRLEVWSGKRGEAGVENTTGAVAFDYSAYSLSSDSYSSVISQYEEEIIASYRKLLSDAERTDLWANENIAYYEQKAEELVASGEITQAQLDAVKNSYNAKYYTYTLYDSAAYVPFNANVAEDGETGYSYNASDFGETLAYLTYTDDEQNSINIFVDYSAVDQSISMSTASTDDDDTDDTDGGLTGDVWLYISSIILVVVLLATLVAILVKDFLKKHKKNKSTKNRNKNVYRQRDRYIRKLHLVKNEEAEETVEPEVSAEEPAVEPEAPAEEPAADVENVEAVEPEVEPVEETAEPEVSTEEPAAETEAPAEDDGNDNNN